MLLQENQRKMSDFDLIYKIAVGKIPNVGIQNTKLLISYLGSVKEVFTSNKSKLLKIPGIGEITTNNILKTRKEALTHAENELKFIENNKIFVSFYLDKDYPFLLKQAPDAPVVFYKKGNYNFDSEKYLAIVGTRKATHVGLENCENLVKDLAQSGHNLVIVSGLAYGIDICAHKAALKYGLKTVAVLGHGFKTIYPPKHKAYAQQIIDEGGALISEFSSEDNFDRNNFLKRNRIIAGLTHASVIVESGERGGSLNTAEIANSYNREVFSFPGRIGDKFSIGCNRLIKKHKAFLIENAEDVEYILAWDKSKQKTPRQTIMFSELSEQEKIIVNILQKNEKAAIDLICRESKMTMNQVSALLLEMEFKDLIIQLPGKAFVLPENAKIS